MSHRMFADKLCRTGQNGKSDEMNKLIDSVFDSAFNTSLVAGDLPYVKWGRIDYFGVTYLTTKWMR